MDGSFHPIRWLFAAPPEPVTTLRVIGWWELRRIPFNVIVGGFGILAFIVFADSIYSAGVLQPGEDAVEPFVLLLTPVAANICYTAGWLVDAPLRFVYPSLRAGFTLFLFRLGLSFSLLVISLPAVIWGGYRLLQLLHMVR